MLEMRHLAKEIIVALPLMVVTMTVVLVIVPMVTIVVVVLVIRAFVFLPGQVGPPFPVERL